MMVPTFSTDRLWSDAVIVTAPGRTLRVASTRDALLCLRNHWSGRAMASRNAAIRACEQVLRGDQVPDLARGAFVEAACAAGFDVKTWSDVHGSGQSSDH